MNEIFLKRLFIAMGSLFLFLFCLIPFFYMIMTSFQEHPDFLKQSGPLHFTLQNYQDVLGNPSLKFMAYLKNSLLVASVSAFLAVWIAALAAFAITRFYIPGKNFLLFSILAASMFPQISLINYLFKIMTELGWINTHPALILPYVAWILPLSLWILVSYFAGIPKELDKAAVIDGCSKWHTLTKVILPVAAPGIFSVGLLSFIFAFNEFLFALMLTTDHTARTVPVGIALFEGTHGQTPWGDIMAASALTTLPVIILTLFFQRRIVQGLTRGAVKG